MKEKALPTRPLRVSEKVHELVKRRALDLQMTMQEVTEFAIQSGLPTQNPKQSGPFQSWTT